MLFRQASVDVRPPPEPDEPVRFGGDAYPPPGGWKVELRVLRRPTSQKDLIAAKQARQKKADPTLSTWTYASETDRDASAPPKPRAYRGDSQRPPRPPMLKIVENVVESPAPPPEPVVVAEPATSSAPPGFFVPDDAYYDAVKEGDATPGAEAPVEDTKPASPATQGAYTTPSQINDATRRARNEAAKGRTFTSSHGRDTDKHGARNGAGGGAKEEKPKGPPRFRANQRISTASDDGKKKSKRSGTSKGPKNVRPDPQPIEVSEKNCSEIALAALSRFKSPNVMQPLAVLAVMIGQRTSRESRQREEVVSYVVKQMMAKYAASDQGGFALKRDLQSTAMSLLGERIAAAWNLVRDPLTVTITAERTVARRMSIARKACKIPETSVFDVLLGEESGREIAFIVRRGHRDRDVLYSAMVKSRYEWWLRGHDAWPLAIH